MKRTIVACALAAVVAAGAAFRREPAPPLRGVAGFALTGSAKLYHFEGGASPGEAAFKTSASIDGIAACIQGAAAGCTGAVIETDPGGTAYLFCDTPTSWRIATNAAGSNATTLTGLMDGKGAYMFAGTHALSGTRITIVGKARLADGTLTPTSVKGTVYGVSNTTSHYGVGKFVTVSN